MKYVYYPGCTSLKMARNYDISARYVMDKLGLKYVEPREWTCCGTIESAKINRLLWLSLNAKIISEASSLGGIIFTICNGCLLNLRMARSILKEVGGDRDRVIKLLEEAGIKYGEPREITHLLDVIVNIIGLRNLSKIVRRRLNGEYIAPFPGCLLIRPRSIMDIDDPDNPIILDKVIELVGGKPVEYDYKTQCCGGPVYLKDINIARDKVSKIIHSIRRVGGEAILTACPLCHITLETIQVIYSFQDKIPVIYFTQLLGYAFGGGVKELGLDYNLTPINNFIKKFREI